MSAPPQKAEVRLSRRPDEWLVKECLRGNEDAWNAILEKYQKLIYSVPIRYGLSVTDAGDIFQQVCVDVLESLTHLREPRSLAAWLIRIASHRCLQWTGRERRFQSFDFEAMADAGPVTRETPDTVLHDLARGQAVHEAIAEIPARCQELIRMLFFEAPAIPYEQVALKLGIAKGSIGFIRMRCLTRLRTKLEARGF
jgi:RNA polymerase sigma factor (sigma-70 family)